ncbi:MAG: DMT family transporter [Marinilabiliales bacterium]|nr:DMT family transporter [Marinilabiliales bacterium]
MMKKSSRAYLYAALSVFLWGTIPTAFKIALAELSIVTMLGISHAGVHMLVLFIIAGCHRKAETPRQYEPEGTIMVSTCSVLSILSFITCILLTAYSRLPGQVAQPLNMIWPIIIVFLSVPLLHQHIPARSFAALFISLAGVYIISSQGSPFHPGRSRRHRRFTGTCQQCVVGTLFYSECARQTG